MPVEFQRAKTSQIYASSKVSKVLENSGLLGSDAVLQGKWLPTYVSEERVAFIYRVSRCMKNVIRFSGANTKAKV
jgi:hypothetical protein